MQAVGREELSEEHRQVAKPRAQINHSHGAVVWSQRSHMLLHHMHDHQRFLHLFQQALAFAEEMLGERVGTRDVAIEPRLRDTRTEKRRAARRTRRRSARPKGEEGRECRGLTPLAPGVATWIRAGARAVHRARSIRLRRMQPRRNLTGRMHRARC